jgi:two-component system sensor histidine kinase VicK
MPNMKPLSSLTLVLSDVTIAFVLTMFLVTWAPEFILLGTRGFVLLFILTASVVALVTVVSLSFAKPNAAAARVIAARDMAIYLREKALNEHTIVSMTHADGRIAAVNQNFVDVLGYAPDDVVGETIQSLQWRNGEDDGEDVIALVSAGATWKGIERLRTKDGRNVTFETTVLPRFDDAGTFENAISIRTDVSRAKAQGVQEGRNATIEGLPDEVYLYDADNFQLTYANENARSRLRRSLDDLHEVNLLDLLSADEKQRFRRHVDPVLSGECPRARLEMEYHGNPLEVLTHLDEGSDGARVLVSIIRDISDRKQAERLRLSSVATVSHELRTPLTSIKGALHLLEAGVVGSLGDDASRMIKVARRNSDRLLAIVNDILVLEKLSSGQIRFKRKPIDLRALLTDAAEANAAFAAECNIRFEVATGDDPALVTGDSDRLMQVLSNLMSNAAKFAPDGSAVTLGIEDRGEAWRVCVTDVGPGIPPEARDTLFDNFTQVPGSVGKKPHEGTGLGLAICREIVAHHQGQIGFDTELGKGSTFYFELQKTSPVIASKHVDRANVA